MKFMKNLMSIILLFYERVFQKNSKENPSSIVSRLSEVETKTSSYRYFSLSDDGTFLWLMNFAFYAFKIDFHGVKRKQNREDKNAPAIYGLGKRKSEGKIDKGVNLFYIFDSFLMAKRFFFPVKKGMAIL